MVKEKVILVGPFVGELYWEFYRFAPYVFKQNKHNYPLVVLTRPDRYDIYGERAIEFSPLVLKGDSTKRFGECFKMIGLDYNDYRAIEKTFFRQMRNKYDIVEHFVPPFTKPDYLNKDFYPVHKRLFDYKPRKRNIELIDSFLNNVTKPIVVLAPRYRKNFKRNWPHWKEFYDKLIQTKWHEKFEFIICGKENEYVPDELKRFKDINDVKLDEKSSLFGLLIEIISRSKLTIGSQSAIPNISLLFKIPALEWGNQKQLHTITYNPYRTSVTYLDSPNFDVPLQNVFNKMVIQLSNIKH